MKHTFKEWFAVTRYWSFPVSLMPVIVTTAYLAWIFEASLICWLNAVLALVGIVFFHAGGNVISDWADYRSGVDNENAFAIPNLVLHKFKPEEYLMFGILLLIIGAVIGLVLVLRVGWPLLVVGCLGALLTVGYSFFKYRALGDLTIFLNFSILPILGTTYVTMGSFYWDALVLALPIGLITVAVLHANNTVDIESDKTAGIKTFAMILGIKASARLYIAYMIIPFACIFGAVLVGRLPCMSLLCCIALLPAIRNLQATKQYVSKGKDALMGMDQKTAQLQLVFSMLLTLGLVIAAII